MLASYWQPQQGKPIVRLVRKLDWRSRSGELPPPDTKPLDKIKELLDVFPVCGLLGPR